MFCGLFFFVRSIFTREFLNWLECELLGVGNRPHRLRGDEDDYLKSKQEKNP